MLLTLRFVGTSVDAPGDRLPAILFCPGFVVTLAAMAGGQFRDEGARHAG